VHSRQTGTLGTFGGVFTPSILTILGIILFLRLGWVVGHAGLGRALVIIGLAHLVSILTSLSLSAIATNRKVRGGGDYHLISRSLGPEYGGALGLVLFAAQSVSVAFYCLGFGEAVAPLLAQMGQAASPRLVAAGAAAVLGAISWLGADLATRFQFVVAFFAGSAGSFDYALATEAWATPEQTLPFWLLFAVFFPAVTGFTQGVSMSGDLRDPARSLPLGTLSAVGISAVIYVATAVAFAGVLPLALLREDTAAFARVSVVPALFQVGVVAATLSSALASFLGAPRILQAMARDEIVPPLSPFAKGAGPTGNPRRALGLTALIAFTVLVFGELNSVARLISMFFLISYGLLNAATYLEARSASPSFRPRFRAFDKRLCLLGALACLGAMFAIDIWAATVAIAVVAALHQYLSSRAVPAHWVDSRRAYEFRRLKDTIEDLDRHPESEWTWQPNILVLSGDAERNDLVLRIATSLSGGSGFVTAVGLIEGEGDLESSVRKRLAAEKLLREELQELQVDVFSLVVAAPDFHVAVDTLLQAWGIGPVRANTALVDWYTRLPDHAKGRNPLWFGRELRGMLRLGCHVLVLDVGGKEWRRVQALPDEERHIDIWWWGSDSCRLALLFAYLFERSGLWRDAPLRLMLPCKSGREERETGAVHTLLEDARIEAEIVIVPDATNASIVERSAHSALVFLPLRIEGMRVVDPFAGEIEELIEALPITILVGASGDVSLGEPEEEPESDDLSAAEVEGEAGPTSEPQAR
jgi:amino acid transporter